MTDFPHQQHSGSDIPADLQAEWQRVVVPQKQTEANDGAQGAAERRPPSQIELLGEIGASRECKIDEAWDHAHQRRVSVYRPASSADLQEAASGDFWERAAFLASLQHNNVVSVFSIDKQRGWYVAEYCPTSIGDAILEGAQPAATVQRLLADALAGLDYLHRSGAVHGEVHPQAIRVAADGTAKLDRPLGRDAGADLRLRDELAKYAAPESLDEARFGRVGCTMDLYALGMVAMELLVGKKFPKLFREFGLDLDKPEGWLRWHMAADTRLLPLAEVVPGLPPSLGSLIDQLLAKTVEERPSSASEALDLLAGRSLVARPAATSAYPAAPEAVSERGNDIVTGPTPRVSRPPAVVQAHQIEPVNENWREKVADFFSESNATPAAATLLIVTAFVAGSLFLVGAGPRRDGTALLLSSDKEVLAPVAPQPPPKPEPDPEPVTAPEPAPPPAPEPRFPVLPAAPRYPQRSQVTINVLPREAEVSVDGGRWVRPDVISALPGDHTVAVREWGYESATKQFTVVSGESAVVSVELTPLPPPIPYEPVLLSAHPRRTDFDEAIKGLLGPAGRGRRTGTMLIHAESEFRDLLKQGEKVDPRVMHALAVSALTRAENPARAVEWYEHAADAAPPEYAWPSKGLVACLLAQDDAQAALIAADDFASRVERRVRGFRPSPGVAHLVDDTTRFLGLVLAWVDRTEPSMLIDRGETFALSRLPAGQRQRLADALVWGRGKYDHLQKRGEPLEVWSFLEVSLTAERRALLQSIGKQASGNREYRVQLPQLSRRVTDDLAVLLR